MRKFYYVCPRCGRCYKHYIPRRKTKCGFCSTVWKTRGAKGTRSQFSWTATIGLLLAIAVAFFFIGRELGVAPDSILYRWTKPATESVETGETTSDAENVETLAPSTSDAENAESVEISETAENAATE